MKIGVIGNGFVGKATQILNGENINLMVYDIDPSKCLPKNTTMVSMSKCELVFICVPTPMDINGECNIDIVKKVVNSLKQLNKDLHIIIRSTVPPGTSDNLGVYFMPEFLTEANWKNDFYNTEHWVFGLSKYSDNNFKESIRKLFDIAKKEDKIKFNNIHFVNNKEAELLKYFKNTYLASKVSFCNEIYDYCKKKDIDYNIVKSLVSLDSRITDSHMNVPGPDGQKGYGGTCFPKDTNALLNEMKNVGLTPLILKSVVERNETIDRPNKDWMSNFNRAVVKKEVKKNILVTGGAGFIGNHLCRELLKDENNYVICIDNFLSGKEEQIEDLMDNKNFKLYKTDIIDNIILNIDTLDEIYHLACPASPPIYQIDPIHTAKTCFIGTLNLLEIAKKYNSKILFTSTSEIYGDPLIKVQSEEYKGNVNTIGPRSCYDEGKRVSETLMTDYNRMYNTDIRIARIFNTYGCKMNPYDGRVVTNFIQQCKSGESITIYGDGSQTRSFCYVDDTVRGLMLLMKSNYIYPVNIGNTEDYTILELSKMVIELTNSDSQIEYKDLPIDDPKIRKPDISRAKKILGWEPKISIKEGLNYMINEIRL